MKEASLPRTSAGSGFSDEQLNRLLIALGVGELEQREVAPAEGGTCAEQTRTRRQTLRVELERRVAERTEELVAANQDMESFCYAVSHDLRAPLRSIIATSRFLLEDLGADLSAEHRELLNRQCESANRLGKLIDDLLQLARIGRAGLSKQEVDLSAVAAAASAEVLSFGWPAKPSISVQAGLRTVGDPDLIRQLLINVFENACKYSPEGGRIEFGRLPLEDENVFFVCDEGIGFDMKYVDKIFLPFERLHRDGDYPGTGVGLANVKKVVEKHGGRIWAESIPNKGSTFYFSI